MALTLPRSSTQSPQIAEAHFGCTIVRTEGFQRVAQVAYDREAYWPMGMRAITPAASCDDRVAMAVSA